jgi:hypothetical protein
MFHGRDRDHDRAWKILSAISGLFEKFQTRLVRPVECAQGRTGWNGK